MGKQTVFVGMVVLMLSVTGYGLAFGAESQGALTESGAAASHASKAAVNSIGASGQATSAVSAVPLAIGGSAGAVSGQAAQDLTGSASNQVGKPLPITDETITVGPPPDQLLKARKPQ